MKHRKRHGNVPGGWMGALVTGLCLCAIGAEAVQVSWTPESPNSRESIRVEIADCTRGGVLHWGVNAQGRQWESPAPVYRGLCTVMQGLAARTRLEGPDEDTVCRVTLGPFGAPEQVVRNVAFAIQWDDGTWDNNGGRDYTIEVSSARVHVSPALPGINDRVRVTVERSAPGGMLRWGVNAQGGAWQPPHRLYWPAGSVPSDDGLAIDSPLSSPDAMGRSFIELGPFSRGEQVVTSLHIAVHWGKTWDSNSNRNYNAEVSLEPAGQDPCVRILSPIDEPSEVEEVSVSVESDCLPVELWLGGKRIAELTNAPLDTAISVEREPWGLCLLAARTVRDGRAGMDAVRIWRAPRIVEKSCPTGTVSGATVSADGTVTFALHAPGKRFVSVVGDFNDWKPEADPMKRSPEGTWWATRVLPKGTYRYQYCVDGVTLIADPFSVDVEWKDAEGAETHHPEMALSVIEVGGEPYAWQSDEFVRPPWNRCVLYELHLGDFCPGEGFTGLVARLDYLVDLGINAVELLPVTEFPGAVGWGYNPAFHLAPESSYGTPGELRRLVDEAHRRGIAVIFDMVLNHMATDGALYQLYGVDLDASPYFRVFLGENWGFPDLDQVSPDLQDYAGTVMRYWIEAYRGDGYRHDATRWVEWSGYNTWGASRHAYEARRADTDTLQIAEHIPSDPLLTQVSEMDTQWDAHFRWRIRDMLIHAELDGGEFERVMDPRTSGYLSSFERLAYTESHDEERIWRDLAGAGYSAEEILRRAGAALALTLTAPGIPMLYAGQEFGEDSEKTLAHNPLHWIYREQMPRRSLWETARRLIRLRIGHPALCAEGIRILENNPGTDVASFRRSYRGSHVVVAINFGRQVRTVNLELPRKGPWDDIMRGGQVNVGDEERMSVTFAPGEALVFATAEP